jgi:micrococcal nuclease
VTDGDTFVVASGETIRALGIDSCEAGAPGGDEATAAARDVLIGAQVTLRAEPGVDRDQYGRLLRYVDVPGTGDFGEHMVPGTHTAVYAGKNDASPTYVSRLRSLDGNGRTCDNPAPPAPPAQAEQKDDRRDRVEPPSSSSGSGNDGGSSSGSAYYPDCKAARAAGAAPIHAGEPGYRPKLDGNSDGVACE